METEPKPEDLDLIYLEKINAVVDWIRRAGLDALCDGYKDRYLNLTARQCMVLSAVRNSFHQDRRGTTLSGLARDLRMSVSAASHLVDVMVENKLLVREVHEGDRRSVRITLTDAGWQCADISRDAMIKAVHTLCEGQTAEESARRMRDIDYLYRRVCEREQN